MPSINGIFATHCSITPPSQHYITSLTHVRFLCLPEMLRSHGYRTEMFNGGDTDWDNSSPWLRQWYDRLWRFLKRKGATATSSAPQRPRSAASAARASPFLASIVSVSNHTPFRTREPALDIAGQASAAERILNTTHYTDDVVGEFLASLQSEPWMARTLIVVTGDHGFNVGEHGQSAGQQNLYRESVWVPLIIAGPHPRLRTGWHEDPATLLDIAPTLADLLGLRVAVPWQGHSLLAVNGGGRAFSVFVICCSPKRRHGPPCAIRATVARDFTVRRSTGCSAATWRPGRPLSRAAFSSAPIGRAGSTTICFVREGSGRVRRSAPRAGRSGARRRTLFRQRAGRGAHAAAQFG